MIYEPNYEETFFFPDEQLQWSIDFVYMSNNKTTIQITSIVHEHLSGVISCNLADI
jgi:hypothetical protein